MVGSFWLQAVVMKECARRQPIGMGLKSARYTAGGAGLAPRFIEDLCHAAVRDLLLRGFLCHGEHGVERVQALLDKLLASCFRPFWASRQRGASTDLGQRRRAPPAAPVARACRVCASAAACAAAGARGSGAQ